MPITVTRRGVLATGRAPEVAMLRLRVWLQGVLAVVRDDVRRFSPKDTGAFQKSVVYRTSARGDALEGRVFSTGPAVLASVIEEGRRPGAKMPPAGALLPWMARHGIPDDREFLVRRKIARDGLPAHRPFARAFQKSRGLLATQARHLASGLVRAMR
jgi:hypothetical protein